jgi:ketosteroid isomerase-like protein
MSDVARNIATVRRFYGAGPADDDAERLPFFADDAVWHVPGENPVSGPYAGVQAITERMVERMAPLDRWEIEARDVMGNADLVVGTFTLRGLRRGVDIETTGAHVFRFDTDGRIAEAWGFTLDQARLDELFRA